MEHSPMKLKQSPKKQKRSTDFQKCLICQKDGTKTNKASPQGKLTFLDKPSWEMRASFILICTATYSRKRIHNYLRIQWEPSNVTDSVMLLSPVKIT